MDDILSPEDIEALVRQLRDDGSDPVVDLATARRIRYPAPRDLTRPEREVVRERLSTASQAMQAAMSAALKSTVRIELVEVIPVSERAFLDATAGFVRVPLAIPGAGGARAHVALEPVLALALVDRALSCGEPEIPERKTLTPVEEEILDGFLRRGLEAFFDSPAFTAAGRFRVAGPDAKKAEAEPEDEAAHGVHFLLSVGGAVPPGELRGFLPDPPARQALSIGKARTATPDDRRRLQAAIQRVPIAISVVVGRASCGVDEISALEAGDVIALDSGPAGAVEVRMGRSARFSARIGRQGRHLAVRINQVIGPKRRTDAGAIAQQQLQQQRVQPSQPAPAPPRSDKPAPSPVKAAAPPAPARPVPAVEPPKRKES